MLVTPFWHRWQLLLVHIIQMPLILLSWINSLSSICADPAQQILLWESWWTSQTMSLSEGSLNAIELESLDDGGIGKEEARQAQMHELHLTDWAEIPLLKPPAYADSVCEVA